MGATPVRVVCFVAALLCVAAEGPSPPVSSPSKLSNSKITKPTLGRAALAKPDEAQPPEREADSADEEESGAVGIVDEGIGAKLARLFNPKSLDQTAGEEGVETAKPRQSMLMMFFMVAVRMVVTIALMYFRKKKRPSGVEEVIKAVGVEEGVSGDAATDMAAAAATAAAGAAGAAAVDAVSDAAAKVSDAVPVVSVIEAFSSGGLVAAAHAAWAKLAAFARSPNAAPVMMVLLIISMKLVARIDADPMEAETQDATETDVEEGDDEDFDAASKDGEADSPSEAREPMDSDEVPSVVEDDSGADDGGRPVSSVEEKKTESTEPEDE